MIKCLECVTDIMTGFKEKKSVLMYS